MRPETMAFASDFDGTLFHHDGTGIHKEDADAIRQWQKEGNLFGLCTGRSLRQLMDQFLPVMQEAGIRPDFMICTSGAVVADGQGNVLVSHEMDRQVMEEVQRRVPEAPLALHTDKPLVVLNAAWNEFPVCRTIPENTRLYGFSAWNRPGLRPDVRDLPLSIHENRETVDYTAAGVTKGTGIQDLCRIFGLRPEKTGRIGDSWNDLAFLEKASYSFTFPWSPDKVRTVAVFTVRSVAEAIQIVTEKERFQSNKSVTGGTCGH